MDDHAGGAYLDTSHLVVLPSGWMCKLISYHLTSLMKHDKSARNLEGTWRMGFTELTVFKCIRAVMLVYELIAYVKCDQYPKLVAPAVQASAIAPSAFKVLYSIVGIWPLADAGAEKATACY
eukprot:2533911-Pleurochrysis_carterae.AAC.6